MERPARYIVSSAVARFLGQVDGVHVVVVIVGRLLGQDSISERGTTLQEQAQIAPVTEATDDVVAVDEGLCAPVVSV